MSEKLWPTRCHHIERPGAVQLEPYAVVTLRNVPEWQGKLHLPLDFECELCPFCAANVTHLVAELAAGRPDGFYLLGLEHGRMHPGPKGGAALISVQCPHCAAVLDDAPQAWLSLRCKHCDQTFIRTKY